METEEGETRRGNRIPFLEDRLEEPTEDGKWVPCLHCASLSVVRE